MTGSPSDHHHRGWRAAAGVGLLVGLFAVDAVVVGFSLAAILVWVVVVAAGFGIGYAVYLSSRQ